MLLDTIPCRMLSNHGAHSRRLTEHMHALVFCAQGGSFVTLLSQRPFTTRLPSTRLLHFLVIGAAKEPLLEQGHLQLQAFRVQTITVQHVKLPSLPI